MSSFSENINKNVMIAKLKASFRNEQVNLIKRPEKDFLERMISILESYYFSHTLSSNLQPSPSEPMHLMGVITDGSLYLPTSCDVLYGD